MICGVADGEYASRVAVKNGQIASIGQNNPIEVAKLSVNVAKQVLVDGVNPATLPKRILTPPVLMTKENIDKYLNANGTF